MSIEIELNSKVNDVVKKKYGIVMITKQSRITNIIWLYEVDITSNLDVLIELIPLYV